jgi:hypothetical protein
MVRLDVAVFMALALGCAGTSVGPEESGGTSGAGGATSGGSGGGGTTTGGRGGAGGMVARGGTAGTVANGGTGWISVGGAAGAGASCGLPLVSGPCQALFFAYGFDPQRGHCVRFPYGGCEGNENRFDTLTECEAACGGSDVGGCPERQPDATTPCESGLVCLYGFDDACLCAPSESPGCSKIDPDCPSVLLDVPPPEDSECAGDECVSRVVVRGPYRCRCYADEWTCAR